MTGTQAIGAETLRQFAAAIEGHFGHGFDPARAADLARLLTQRMQASAARDAGHYLGRLDPASEEWHALAPLLTVPETYFFRLPDQFEALAEAVLPKLMRANERQRRLRILSAGCASGEEAYTLRIVLNERFPHLAGWKVEIDGFDVSQPALDRAREAVYSEWALRATSVERRRANFAPVAGSKQFRLLPHARAGVSFTRGNLLDPASPAVAPYDVVFCRNVLIYFTESAIRRAIQGLAQRMAPAGYLFLGPAESLRGISRNFSLCHTHDVFYYRRRQQLVHEEDDAVDAEPRFIERDAAAGAVPAMPAGASWYGAIQESSRRLALLTATAAKTPRSRKPGVAPSVAREPAVKDARAGGPSEDLFTLLRCERFAEVLDRLNSAAAKPSSAGSLRLIRACVLTHLGRFPEADVEAKALIEADPLSAGGHFVRGLCREQAGELAEAEEQMTQATYLDPGFALPQLHRGALALRRGDSETALTAFARAYAGLAIEDNDRLALFAGSHSRESLRATCRRELARLEAA